MASSDSVQATPSAAASWADRLFRRQTATTAYVAELDGLRFLAIAWVVVFHLNAYVRGMMHGGAAPDSVLVRLMEAGHLGVPLFFAISGFILAVPFARHILASGPPVSLGAYLLRRVTRLEPPYLLCMVGLAAAMLVLGLEDPGAIGRHLGASLLYAHGFIYGAPSTINTVAWSLEVEVQFYLLAPALTAVLFRLPPVARRGVLVVLMIAFPLAQAAWAWSGYHLLGCFQYFAAGILLAELKTCGQLDRLSPRAWDAAGLAGLLAIGACALADHATTLLAPVTLVAYAGVLAGHRLRRAFAVRPLSLIGGACYTIYLLHYAIISATGRLTSGWTTGSYGLDIVAQGVLMLVPLAVVCGAFFVLIERPCMDPRWPRRLIGRLRAAPPGGEAVR